MCCIYFQLPWTSFTWQPQILSLQLSFALGKLLLSTWEFWDTCRHQSPKSPAFEHQCYPVVQPTLVEARPNLSKMTRISVSLGNKPTQSNPGREAARDLLQLLQLFTCLMTSKNMNCGTMKHTVIWVICQITPSPFTICPLWSPELPQLPKREPVLGCSNTFSKASVNLGETIRNLKVRELALGNPYSSHPSYLKKTAGLCKAS